MSETAAAPELEAALAEVKKAWRRGELCLAEIGGFTDKELDAAVTAASRLIISRQTGEALQVIGSLIFLKPREPKYYHLAGLALHAAERFDLADAYYRLALAINPEDVASLVYRGEVNLYLGKRKQGLSMLRRALELARGKPALDTFVMRARAVERAFLEKPA